MYLVLCVFLILGILGLSGVLADEGFYQMSLMREIVLLAGCMLVLGYIQSRYPNIWKYLYYFLSLTSLVIGIGLLYYNHLVYLERGFGMFGGIPWFFILGGGFGLYTTHSIQHR